MPTRSVSVIANVQKYGSWCRHWCTSEGQVLRRFDSSEDVALWICSLNFHDHCDDCYGCYSANLTAMTLSTLVISFVLMYEDGDDDKTTKIDPVAWIA